MNDLIWSEPYRLFFLIFALLPWWTRRRGGRVGWPSLSGFPVRPSLGAKLRSVLPDLLKGFAIACVVMAAARPQTVGGTTRIAGKGVAIVAAIDQSSSMKALDFPDESGPISRLEAAKATFARFVERRPDDLIGLVAFANYPDLACPLTLDHVFLIDVSRSLKPARPSDDGTNLGDALVWGLQALESSENPQKVLILLTDGRNSPAVPRPTPPEFAAELALKLGVKVHTVAMGKPGGNALIEEPVTKLEIQAEVDGPDLEELEKIAKLGGGRAFVATDSNALEEVFQTIDALEKSHVQAEIRTRYDERFAPFAATALVLLAVDFAFSAGVLRSLP